MSEAHGKVVYIQPDRHNHRKSIYEHPDNYPRGSIARCSCGLYLTTKRNIFRMFAFNDRRWSRIWPWNLKARRNLHKAKTTETVTE